MRPTLELLSKEWAGWVFDPKPMTLCFTKQNGNDYAINLSDMKTSAAVLDWIMQVATWGDPDVIAGFVLAVHDLLHPQACLCSTGIERGPIDPIATIRQEWDLPT